MYVLKMTFNGKGEGVNDNANVTIAFFHLKSIYFYLKQKKPQKILFCSNISQRQRSWGL